MTQEELDIFLEDDWENNQGSNIDVLANPYNHYPDRHTPEEIFKLVYGAAKKAKKIKDDRKMDKLAKNIADLDLNDDPMDTSNLTDGSIVLQDADGNEFTAYLTRGSKKK